MSMRQGLRAADPMRVSFRRRMRLKRPLIVDAAVARTVRAVYAGTEFLRLSPEEQYRPPQCVVGIVSAHRRKYHIGGGREVA